MLAHSPPLPLVIDYAEKDQIFTSVYKENIKLALRHHDRVRRIRFVVSRRHSSSLQTLIDTINREFPILEYLYIDPLTYSNEGLVLPETFRAPKLRHLILWNFSLPVGSSLLAAATGLITFWLECIPLIDFRHPVDFLHCVSSMPHLQTLGIPVCNWRRVMNTPKRTHVVLPNLRWLGFKGFEGGNSYMEALLPHMSTPRLEKLQISFLEQTMSIPNLQQFISSAENLRFTSASLRFDTVGFTLEAYPCQESRMYALSVDVVSLRQDWPLSSTTRIIGILGPLFSIVTLLSVQSPSVYNEADRAEFRDILKSFNNVKALSVRTLSGHSSFIKDISRALTVRDGESTMELLPGLKELEWSAKVDAGDLSGYFSAFIYARQQAGHPVTLINKL
jgi:hypothetical protein